MTELKPGDKVTIYIRQSGPHRTYRHNPWPGVVMSVGKKHTRVRLDDSGKEYSRPHADVVPRTIWRGPLGTDA